MPKIVCVNYNIALHAGIVALGGAKEDTVFGPREKIKEM